MIVIQEGGSDELLDELEKLMKTDGWNPVGFDYQRTRQEGDKKTPCPMFSRTAKV